MKDLKEKKKEKGKGKNISNKDTPNIDELIDRIIKRRRKLLEKLK